MLLLNPSRAQRSIALGRQASTKPRCHLALQPELKHTGGLLTENPSLGGSSTAAGAACTLGPLAADPAALGTLHRQRPTTPLPLKLWGKTPSKAFKIREISFIMPSCTPHCPRSGLKALPSLWFQLFRVSKLWGPRQQQLKVSAKFNFSGMRQCHTEP